MRRLGLGTGSGRRGLRGRRRWVGGRVVFGRYLNGEGGRWDWVVGLNGARLDGVGGVLFLILEGKRVKCDW